MDPIQHVWNGLTGLDFLQHTNLQQLYCMFTEKSFDLYDYGVFYYNSLSFQSLSQPLDIVSLKLEF